MSSTNGNSNRDDELELIRQLLIATATRAESTDNRLDRLAEETDARFNRLLKSQEHTQQQLDQLTEDVDIAFQTIGLLSQNTDREMAEFRAAILGIQEENRRIWQYLLGQQRNGNSGEPQP